ncbi:TraR/DksA C4-type zinc finger protein [Gammaproteobacteria bacterium]|nr:TraR/DksA C4-type zinc finger protein [Gammaproteobacteria bacterium]
MAEYLALKEQLEQRKNELIIQFERLKSDISKPYDTDWSEQAQERENDEVLDELSANVGRELEDINDALERLSNNEYGVCTLCSSKIPLERLNIKPETAFCVNCAEESKTV